MSPRTLTRPPRSRPVTGRRLGAVAAVIATAVLVLLGSWVVRGPEFVDQVSIENPTRFDIDVDVAGSDGRILELTRVDAGRTKTVRDVIDQGRSWTVTFSYAGTEAGSVGIDRDTLEDRDWTIEVPASVGDELEAAGYEPRSR
jgi:hypothetical protein